MSMRAIEGTTQTVTDAAIRALYSEIKHGRLRPEEAVRRIGALREQVRTGAGGGGNWLRPCSGMPGRRRFCRITPWAGGPCWWA